ncbi:mannose-1-phosphate guanylyltransferase/mannose-6-phosphate isomerase [Pigmentiphaga sp. H8]|uniref:mannose-1-phosphate guanylyltransferase/mannose-6-phosphate isomerase n=1 Tax=Pigmentiphaga sp. H8 TaxID=2488560 RepID=UPI000F5970DE|nr:mannose-1-phosphate guanylyltransferase/mannose-6-phosphate isomerase [Pigmentiphaga sp. H8]AZG10472.1 mannose-1-phosphate guanylyltransferase/mannose-6-phosphate isomerase [Pigmentiphaga sp. H8]
MGLVPIILSGGKGTRLWPVSRELHPKPFIRLADGESFLQKAYRRAIGLDGVSRVITVTNRMLSFKTMDEYRALGQSQIECGMLLEPEGRNTAPAFAAAAAAVSRRFGPQEVLLFLTADHLIQDFPAFRQAVEQAVQLAQAGRIVTFGIRPESPETGYGYIEASGTDVLRFVEKPSLDRAQEFLASGRYLWNSGMFCVRADVAEEELKQHAPEAWQAAEQSLAAGRTLEGQHEWQIMLDEKAFALAPDISVDHALMEKTGRASVVPCDIGWSDIGSWAAFGNLFPSDGKGNQIDGDVIAVDTENCYVHSDARVVGAIGLKDLVIVDTPDALLVARKDKLQDIKSVVAHLKERGDDAYQIHRTVHRPWGTYTVLEEAERFKIKRIVVHAGQSLSLQMHHHRSEHWIVVSGVARVTNGEDTFLVNSNESTYIPAGHKHRLENPGIIDLVMIEVQSGEYLGEDDIVRFADIYGRN